MTRLALIDGHNLSPLYQSSIDRLTDVSIRDFAADDLGGASTQDIDAVIVHSSLANRVGVVCAAAESGKHVLVCTPLAETIEQRERAIRACESSGVSLVVSNCLRFSPYQRTVKQSISSGKIGEPGLLRIHHWQPAASTSPEHALSQNGSHELLELVAPELDLACWMFDANPDFVYATRFGDGNTPPTGSGLQVHLGFSTGGMALIDCSFSLPATSPPYYSLTMIGSNGAAYADDHRNTNLVLGNEALGLTVPQGHEWIHHQLTEFISIIKSKTSVVTTADAFSVTQAAFESLKTQQTIKLSGGRYESC